MGNPRRIQDVVSVEVSRITPSTITDWPAGCYWTGDPLPSLGQLSPLVVLVKVTHEAMLFSSAQKSPIMLLRKCELFPNLSH